MAEVLKELLRFRIENFVQPWKNLLEEKVEKLLKGRNEVFFQIPNSPPYPAISMLNIARNICQKPKIFQTTLK